MNCAQCHHPLEPGALFCGNCGAVVGVSYQKPDHGAGFDAPPRPTKPPPAPAPAMGAPMRGNAPAAPPPPRPTSGASAVSGLIARAKGIVLRPRTEWPAIAAEPATAAGIWFNYVAPMAAIGAVAMLLGQAFVGTPVPLIGVVRATFAEALGAALLLFGLTLANVFVLVLLVDWLAPKFGGARDGVRALKLVAYSYTPAWLAGVIYLVPVLSGLSLFASLYGLYILWLGVPLLTRVPKEEALGYTGAIVASGVALFVLVGVLTSCAAGFGPLMFG